MSVHRIRLREPWRRKLTKEGVRWERKFNRPTGLEGKERVWVVVEHLRGGGEVRLNGRFLGGITAESGEGRFEITGQLEIHNLLTLLVAGMPTPLPPALPGAVRLEIIES
ncbi:MAG: hypothetical protein HUU20_22270 [Pirellulales bacterium]|nr:hypothetical protein [Pirellulales bacterium]